MIGIRVPACRPAPDVAEYLRTVEQAGFDFAGLVDSQLVTRDVFVTIALAAQRTTTLGLYTAVTNPVTRHVSVLAGAARTVHEIAPDRVGFFVGSGYSAASTIGRRPATLQEMEVAVSTLRSLLAGESVRLGGAVSRLHFAGNERPPVYVAATGPKMLELAGELADGVLLGVGGHPGVLEEARELVARGAARAGRDPDDLELYVWVRTVVDHDRDRARREARPLVAQWVIDPYRARWLRAAGLAVPSREELPPELLALYPDVTHAEDHDAAVAATAFLSDDQVDEIADVIGIIGTPAHAVERLRELERSGYRNVYLMTSETYDFPETTVRLYADEILPEVRGRA
jgi:5,10-methylenetetrahydromethanopterin reductase